jgi:hypothetical protein
VEQLNLEVARLREDVDRYRTAVENTLKQLDWCIDYFRDDRQHGIADSLHANRAHIRSRLTGPAEQAPSA